MTFLALSGHPAGKETVALPLPACDYRLDTLVDEGVARHICTHPRMCAPATSAIVKDQTCRDCGFCGWQPAIAIASYTPRRKWSPTVSEFSARVDCCTPCEHRRENYCRKAGGACGLLFSLTKASFVCPIGVFRESSGASGGIKWESTEVVHNTGQTAETVESTTADEPAAGDGDGQDAAGSAGAAEPGGGDVGRIDEPLLPPDPPRRRRRRNQRGPENTA